MASSALALVIIATAAVSAGLSILLCRRMIRRLPRPLHRHDVASMIDEATRPIAEESHARMRLMQSFLEGLANNLRAAEAHQAEAQRAWQGQVTQGVQAVVSGMQHRFSALSKRVASIEATDALSAPPRQLSAQGGHAPGAISTEQALRTVIEDLRNVEGQVEDLATARADDTLAREVEAMMARVTLMAGELNAIGASMDEGAQAFDALRAEVAALHNKTTAPTHKLQALSTALAQSVGRQDDMAARLKRVEAHLFALTLEGAGKTAPVGNRPKTPLTTRPKTRSSGAGAAVDRALDVPKGMVSVLDEPDATRVSGE